MTIPGFLQSGDRRYILDNHYYHINCLLYYYAEPRHLEGLQAAHASGAPEIALHGVHVLNGPNLNLPGTREPHIYGRTTLTEIEQRCQKTCSALSLGLVFRQTNHEGQLVE